MLVNKDKDGIYFQAWKNLFENTTKNFWLYNQNSQEISRCRGRMEKQKETFYSGTSSNLLLEAIGNSSINPSSNGVTKQITQKCDHFTWKDTRNHKTETHAKLASASTVKQNQPYLLTDGKKCFQCPQCKYATDRKNNLKRHLGTMHRDCGKLLQCCDSVFSSKAALRDHIFAVHKAGYRCQFCGRSFCRKALLKRHEMGHDVEDDVSRSGSSRKQMFHSDMMKNLTIRGTYDNFNASTSTPVDQTDVSFQVHKIPNLNYPLSPHMNMTKSDNVFYRTVNIFQHLEQQFLFKNKQIGNAIDLSKLRNCSSTKTNLKYFQTSDSYESDSHHKIYIKPQSIIKTENLDNNSSITNNINNSNFPKKHKKLFLSQRLLKENTKTSIDEDILQDCKKFHEKAKRNGRLLLGDNRRLCRNVYRCSVCKSEFDNQMELAMHHHK